MHEVDAVPQSLEETFEGAELAVRAANGRLRAAKEQLTRAEAAAKKGDVGALARAVNLARSALRESEPYLEQASGLASRDFATLIRNNDLAHELVNLATAARLDGVRLVHGVVFSFPVMVAPAPEKLGVRIGKKVLKTLRPSVLLRQLEALRERRPNRRHLERLLQAIEAAYVDATRGQYEQAVKIADIYNRLTPLPDQRNVYPNIDFIGDLYLLERENVMRTDSNRVISFPASTGTRGGNAIRITTETGQERLYSSIRFD